METELNYSTIACNNSDGSYHCNDTVVEMEEAKIEVNIVVVVLLSIFCVVGTIGNATSFYIYFKRRDKSTSVIFILALAGTDFLTCLIIVPYTIAFELLKYRLYFDFPCKLYLFLITSNIPFSAYIMTAIAFDRYFCICHPFFNAFTVRRAKIIVWCLACLAFTFGTITSLSYGTYAYSGDPEDDISMFTEDDSHNTTSDILDVMYDISGKAPEEYPQNATSDMIEPAYDYPANENDQFFHVAICHQNGIILSQVFINNYYQKVYIASFIVAFVFVVILYVLIYRSILMHRSKKAKRKKKNNYTSVAISEPEPTNVNTLTTTLNGNSVEKGKSMEKSIEKAKQKAKRPSTVKETTLYANIKTALMLFVVTIVFTIAFLPSFLMALELLPFNMIVFYMYFSYNVANPIIYAFMNQTFRDDLKNIVKMCK